MAEFERAQPGEKVYSISGGWGTIVERIGDMIVIDFNHGHTYEYTLDGKCDPKDVRPEIYKEHMIVIPQKSVSDAN